MSAAAPLYQIRSPEQTILYSVVASELETFLAEQRSAEHEVPRFVEREFRAFLGCGVAGSGSSDARPTYPDFVITPKGAPQNWPN